MGMRGKHVRRAAMSVAGAALMAMSLSACDGELDLSSLFGEEGNQPGSVEATEDGEVAVPAGSAESVGSVPAETADAGTSTSEQATDVDADNAEDAATAEDDQTGPEELWLYSDELHDIPTPVPGTAEVAVAGTTYVVEDLGCSIDDDYVGFLARSESQGEQVEVHAFRGTGGGMEQEGLQLTLVGGTDARELNAIGIVQVQRLPGQAPSFLQGSGDYPTVRVVGDQMTVVGTFLNMGGDPETEGEFTMAADCS